MQKWLTVAESAVSRVRTRNFITPPSGGFFLCGILGSSSKALFNFAPRELLSITQAKFLCKRLVRVLLKSFLYCQGAERGAEGEGD